MSAPWIVWLAAAGVIVILEIFSGTFYLLMIAIGAASGAAVAWFGGAPELQLIAAGVVGVTATWLLRRSRLGKIQKSDSSRDPNVNLDIGQTVYVGEWRHVANGRPVARISYRGAEWDAELAGRSSAEPGTFVIQEMRGSHLILSRLDH
jgi:membrane protein implicated in regulation of membrane protease activity